MARQRQGQLHLGAFIYFTGHHHAGWRHPASGVEQMFDIEWYKKIAQSAERGKFDMIFFADLLHLIYPSRAAAGMLDPVALLSSLAMVTDKIGLTATLSTTYNEPYNAARRFATLDHLSKGRAGWNIVTSQVDTEAHNFGREKHPAHGTRYEMAKEFVDVVTALWDSWPQESLVMDRASGSFTDESKLRKADYSGQWYSTKQGLLNVPRPPQGYPVLIQAGSSGPGQDFAASVGEVIFTAQTSLTAAQEFYRTVNEKLVAGGRERGSLHIMPGLSPILGSTVEEARRKERELLDLIDPQEAVMMVSGMLQTDLSAYPADGPLPDIPDPVEASNGMKSRVQLIMDLARKDNLSIIELGRRLLGARGHMQFVGTPEQLADLMEEWFDGYGCDGFNIMPPVLPGDLDDFVDQVVPVLQRRGLYREEYEGSTLREHLGLSNPSIDHFKKLASLHQ
ncbi:FMN-dependent oxidoreductase (nitrilotriacetate monooxygenase family) [Paenibacillus cellulosilyticus]|uniref:FMN-dependent oxidoreductase (Nitrilotriacetate monooxygenase family) n=1 Tax=Paenibacillus cellulosilyticus TaxID=375489 RepID=A0A2V2Z1G9_9BACL|nr:LLM class flavin-dependent oxidoreductase [Paenibacillus cellulosilyticus]PWW08707.1 FMN-dependent oxidoreductase (nitrilotriacetate monooxygenase family) [Paenibacillus cellulosilyticus]QKS48273.1 LLM class flavin-dependent oxidoreductase [Paenibacillus cellulosilyticus]